MIIRFVGNYLVVMGISIASLAITGNSLWLLNFAAAAIGALAVIIGSSVSYKKMIKNSIALESRDPIDKIEDPYDLYDDKENSKPAMNDRFKMMAPSLSPLRLFGYLILVVGFFILYTNELFLPLPYISGLLITPIAILILYFQTRSN